MNAPVVTLLIIECLIKNDAHKRSEKEPRLKIVITRWGLNRVDQ